MPKIVLVILTVWAPMFIKNIYEDVFIVWKKMSPLVYGFLRT